MTLPVWAVASGNAGKLREFDRIFSGVAELKGPSDFPAGSYRAPIEDGATFLANARKKAVAGVEAFGEPCLADDSGLVVEALGGAPGVLTARYAGQGGDDEANMGKLLRELSGVKNRRAYFACALCLRYPDGREFVAEGRCHGSITESRSGTGGFGYDPIFQPEGQRHTMAELTPSAKHELSHRGLAARALLAKLCPER